MILAILGLILFCFVLAVYPFNEAKSGQFEPIPDIPFIIYLAGVGWFGICITRQRSNDISGNNALLWMFVSLFLIGPIIGFLRGEKTSNRYGSPPKKFNLFE
jgi:uncharacterized membrane protein YhaH (DUF805 family)